MKALAGLILCVVAAPAFAQSLCTPAETIVFTCSAKPKIVSICASKDLAPHRGYMQFRIGTRPPAEISYPANRHPRANIITQGYADVGQGPPGHYLMLTDGRNAYAIVTTDNRGPQYGEEETAFSRLRDGKPVESLVCDALSEPTEQGEKLLDQPGFKDITNDNLPLP